MTFLLGRASKIADRMCEMKQVATTEGKKYAPEP